jgi:hypothetical protein
VQGQEDEALARQHSADAAGRVAREPHPGARATLDAARRQAASICLTAREDPATPAVSGRLAQPPVVVPLPASINLSAPLRPAGSAPTSAAPLTAPSSAAPVYKPVMPGPIITGCDAYGCNASDGSRLNRVGPTLIGPRGACSTQGPWLLCP